MNIRLLSLLLLTPSLTAIRTKKNIAMPEEKAFYKKGQTHMKKLVTLCKKKKFDGNAYDAAMQDKSMSKTFEALEANKHSPTHQNALKNYKSYLRGMKSELATYRPTRRNPQDAVIRYNKKNVSSALKATNWETILENNRQESKRFMKRMQDVRWEILAQLA